MLCFYCCLDKIGLLVVFYFYGGGFVCGLFEDVDFVVCFLVECLLVFVVLVDYLFVLVFFFLVVLEDVYCVVVWVVMCVCVFGGNLKKIGVVGYDVGG